jgi:polyisoprenoid-binding protein YceI
MKRLLLLGSVLALAALSPTLAVAQAGDRPTTAASQQATNPSTPVPAGRYVLDPEHASLHFRVNHLGFSNYTARFKRFDSQLDFDPANLARSRVSASVDARSLETDYPNVAKVDFNAELQKHDWLDTARYPQMTFRSTSIELTAPNAMRIHGELTLHGVTRPVTLEAKYNGGYAGHPLDPQARIGFSARGTLRRSEFGVSSGIPAPGTTMGVSDEVELIIEAEYKGPPLKSLPRT